MTTSPPTPKVVIWFAATRTSSSLPMVITSAVINSEIVSLEARRTGPPSDYPGHVPQHVLVGEHSLELAGLGDHREPPDPPLRHQPHRLGRGTSPGSAVVTLVFIISETCTFRGDELVPIRLTRSLSVIIPSTTPEMLTTGRAPTLWKENFLMTS